MAQPDSPLRPPTAKPKKSRKKLYWILGGSLLFVALCVGAAMKSRGDRAISVTTEKAVIKTITQLVSATGRIQPEVEVKISGEVAGEIIELPVVEGQMVKQGDLLARIKPDYYQAQVEQQQALVASAKATVLQSEAQAEKAELDFNQVDTLRLRGLVSETDFNSARSAVRVARANLASSHANLLRSESALRQAEDQLSKTTILAPRDGTISILNSKLGERVVATGQFSGTEIMRVADLEKMEVRVNVNENDVINVKIADTARVRIDAFQGREFRGSVREIANTARTAGQGSADEVTNFEVRISVNEPGVRLRPGMSATADIETQVVTDVVAVPSQCVAVRTKDDNKTTEEVRTQRTAEAAQKQSGGAATAVNDAQRREQERLDRENLQRIVFVRVAGKAEMRKVTTGLMDNTHTEIVSGLKEGEEVVTGPYRAVTQELKDATKITIQPAKKDGKADAKKTEAKADEKKPEAKPSEVKTGAAKPESKTEMKKP
ncbi:MAG: efflux RND transporter periplasmic adaptor subunit [Opitutaceae bacterium]|nr:efflux RND transporter periplasmic adaptor subunit [Opitutaceae bacterium]